MIADYGSQGAAFWCRFGAGVFVVSELDASRYVGKGLKFRPFTPHLPHRISLVRPLIKRPSMVTLEFIDHFAKSLAPFTD